MGVSIEREHLFSIVLNTKLDLEDYRIARALGVVMPYKMYPNTTLQLPSKLLNPSHEAAYFIQHNSNPFIQDSPLVQYSLSGLISLANYTIRVTVNNSASAGPKREGGEDVSSITYFLSF